MTAIALRRYADLTPGEREAVESSPAGHAWREDPMFSAISEQILSDYHGHRYSGMSLVAWTGGAPAAILPAFALEGRCGLFNFPTRIFYADANAPVAPDLANALLRHLRDVNQKSDPLVLDLVSDPVLERILPDYSSTRTVDQIAYVDLRQSVEEIRRQLRKSYRSLINWGLRELEFRIVDHGNADLGTFLELRDFHRRVAGRSTRSDRTWELQFELIRQRGAFALLASHLGMLVSGTLILHSTSRAYYGVGVYDRALMSQGKPMAHAAIFKSILHCRDIGLTRFDLGETGPVEDPKLAGIRRFKAGFSDLSECRDTIHIRLRG